MNLSNGSSIIVDSLLGAKASVLELACMVPDGTLRTKLGQIMIVPLGGVLGSPRLQLL